MTTKPLPGKDPVETIKRNKPEAVKDERYKDQPIVKAEKVKKAMVNDQLTDVIETDRYPRGKQSENYRVDVVAPLTGIPMVEIKPFGWVGPAPLRVPESRLDELIELLSQVR
jgi:hypothetical protein